MDAAREKLRRPNNCLAGSALILTVVLTSLLAIVGVLFLMISRIDRMATSGISEDKQLDLAVDAAIVKISTQLVWDVPGTQIPNSMIYPNGIIFPAGVVDLPHSYKRPEYHDYPGLEDTWLASSEPNDFMRWAQISDVTGYLTGTGQRTRNVPIAMIRDDVPIVLHPVTGKPFDQPADADGDGIEDSKWFELEGIKSSKGETIYAAVRITDNCGKIDINTAFKFDPCDPSPPDSNSPIDGRSLWQINLMALANRPNALIMPLDEKALLWARANNGVNLDPCDLYAYERFVGWGEYERILTKPYTPFDISDELELRNRFLLDQREVDTRIERLGWPASFVNKWTLEVPIGQGGSGMTEIDWFARANRTFDRAVLLPDDNRYDYRHLATAYSVDRIINPAGPLVSGGRMVNFNGTFRVADLVQAVEAGLKDADPASPPGVAAQIVANIIDFVDEDSDVKPVQDSTGVWHHGYERPCVYISEVAGVYVQDRTGDYTSYAIELYKPYFEDDPPPSGQWGWRIVTDPNAASGIPITWSGSGRFHVILLEEDRSRNDLVVDFNDPEEAIYKQRVPSYQVNANPRADERSYRSLAGQTIYLQRRVSFAFPTGGYITVDSYPVPPAGATGGWLSRDGVPRSYHRDISRHKCIRRFWANNCTTYSSATLGNKSNSYVDSDTRTVQAHPYLDPYVYREKYKNIRRPIFKNIAEIGMVFDVSGYNVPVGSTEQDLRLDWQNPLRSSILNYVTVIDPEDHFRGNRFGEVLTRVRGRININTAPPFVLEQLPWMKPKAVGSAIADMVVAYRDGLPMPGPVAPDFSGRPARGFRNIAELMQVWVSGYPGYFGMDYYGADGIDQAGVPDFTPLKILGNRDDAVDDFEERDLIFHRISNLITVRSDAFSAYILVRIGQNGPQRRVLAILDRSEVYPNFPYNPDEGVKIRALRKITDPW